MSRRAPVQTFQETSVPWEISAEAWKEYAAQGHGNQSHERVCERGGWGVEELATLLYRRIKRLEAIAAQPAPERPPCKYCGGTGQLMPLSYDEGGVPCPHCKPAPDNATADMPDECTLDEQIKSDIVAHTCPKCGLDDRDEQHCQPAPSAASGWICRACLNKHGETALYRFHFEMRPGCQEYAESVLTEPWPEVTRTYRDPRLSEKKSTEPEQGGGT